MKTIILMFSQIMHYGKRHGFIFALYALGCVLCGISFAYFFENSVSYLSYRASQEFYYRQYIMDLETDSSFETVVSKLQAIDLESYTIGLHPDDSLSTDRLFAVSNDKPYIVLRKGRLFTEEEAADGAPVIVIPASDSTPISSAMDILGQTYTVIGQHTASIEYYIPFSSFCKLRAAPETVVLTAHQKPASKDDPLLRQIQTAFPGNSVLSPARWGTAHYEQSAVQMVLLCLLYGLVLISFVYLMKFMIESNAEEHILYAIVGASKSKIVQLLIIQNLSLGAIFGVSSLGLHRLLNPVFKWLNWNETNNLSLKDYGLIYILIVFSYFLTTLPFVVSYCKNSLMENRRKYTD